MQYSSLFAIVVVAVLLGAFLKTRAQRGPSKKKYSCKLLDKKQITHDTILLKFAGGLGLTVGKHLSITADINGQSVQRKYTPVSPISESETFDLLIKVYKPKIHPKFPDGGKMSQYLDGLKLGDNIEVQSPFGRFNYPSPGKINIEGFQRIQTRTKSFFMIAGGTGITPIFQVTNQILKNPNDQTNLIILFANKTEDDILLYNQLKSLQKNTRVKVFFTVDYTKNPEWDGFVGFLSKEMIQNGLKWAGSQTFCLLCGPGMMVSLASDLLLKENIPQNRIFSF